MTKIKRILYVITQSEWGGAQKYIYDLVTSPEAQKYNVTVAIGNTGDRSLTHKLQTENIKIHQLKYLTRPISPISDSLAIFELKNLYKDLQPDIIHLNSTKAGILGSLATFKLSTFNFRLIYTAHGWVFNEPMNILKKKLYLWLEKSTAKFKNKIICVSDYDRQIALKNKIISENKLITIHNGINTKINFLPKEEALKKIDPKFQINNSDFIIGTIANFYKTKGLKYLIEAFSILQKDSSDSKLIIIGEGELRPQLEQQIKNLELEQNVILAGKKESASRYLKAFDVYVCSSIKEGFPYSILEAMLAKLTIVTTKVGGIPEIIKDNHNGILTDKEDPQQLAEKINYIIQNKTEIEKLAQQAKIDIEEKFSKEKFIEKTFLQYQ